MNLNNLRVFATIAETGSLSETAQRLFLTQPAVSQQIKHLEQVFAIQLLERTNRGVTLTDAGEVLKDYARKIVSLYDELESAMEGLRASVSGQLTVGATSTIGGYAVPCSICIFKEKFPEAVLKLKVANRQQIINDLKEGRVDIALIEGKDLKGPFVACELAVDQLVIIAPNRKPWTGRTWISIEELKNQPFIIREAGSGTRQVIEETLNSIGIDLSHLNIVVELASVDSIKAAVEAGVGISIMSRLALRKELHTRTLLALELEGLSFEQKIYLAYNRERIQTRLGKAFINFLRSPNRGFC
ncbi:HTH-type transcriptional activator CmpR [Neomoorella glycerini]|uniref:HTH-type transcriptional activator CmpR n=1 Tax=Neomoorella glycerini TaxID=55779 RepID=A0A6I5ZPA7_9FIRM|nr:selenium metabolism-associated LysR family transcriptional regulator [Moorella glycerini]QGP91445.1 HTH-type transcriptional activator CmpR [Moorella glycerini]